jgi:hypothetical protein
VPDPLQILKAAAAAALTAAVVLLLLAWPWRAPNRARVSAGYVLGIGLGFFVGCWVLGTRPHWPPREDQDRLLLVLLPAVMVVELIAAVAGRFPWLVWALRLLVAAGAVPVLLYNSTYLTDLAGPGTRQWTPTQTWLVLGVLAGGLAVAWILLALLDGRSSGRWFPLTLAIAAGGAGLTIMLSGYASGGQMGLSLAAALAGAMVASLAIAWPQPTEGALGVGVVGLFGLIVVGHFFGELATSHALLLFLAPLLAWLGELPYVRRLRPFIRSPLRVCLTAVPVAVALLIARQNFMVESARTSGDTNEPSIQDYMNYGK